MLTVLALKKPLVGPMLTVLALKNPRALSKTLVRVFAALVALKNPGRGFVLPCSLSKTDRVLSQKL